MKMNPGKGMFWPLLSLSGSQAGRSSTGISSLSLDLLLEILEPGALYGMPNMGFVKACGSFGRRDSSS